MPSPGRAPGHSWPHPGARDRAGAARWPPEFSGGFRGAPASESPGSFLKSTTGWAAPRTGDSRPRAGPGNVHVREQPGWSLGALDSGKLRWRIPRVLRRRSSRGGPTEGTPCARAGLPGPAARRLVALRRPDPREGTALSPGPPDSRSAPAFKT